ncbi:major facilitator superfamily domain-containing protein [Xylaria sp. FL1777]|nr:major facilitator superfamily domain-containing protein [Xylaria sp. FL1777]
MWWPKMATAGQYGPGYTAIPPTVVEQRNTAADGPDENRYAPYQDTGWGYQHNHGINASDQTIGHSVEEQWQHQDSGGVYGWIYPAGHHNGEEFVQYSQAAAMSTPAAQWSYQHHQNHTNGIAVPQAVYNSQEGWAYYGNGTQYWNHHGAEQQMNEIPPRSDTSQYMQPQQTQSMIRTYGQEGYHQPLVDNPNALLTSSKSTSSRSDKWQHRTALMSPIISESLPRQKLAPWKWRLMFIVCNILSLVNGYDLSNIANIQGPVYKAFGDIHLLPWVALSYSICNVIATPLARKLYKFYNIKVLTISGLVLMISGTALEGAAPNFVLLIIGRAIMAFGASIVYQGILSFTVIFSYPSEIALVHASIGATFSFGVLTGPVIGAAFAQNEHATWRWSFYVSLPIVAIALLLSIIALPSYSASTEKSVSRHFKEIDWVGHILHSATFISFSLATVFSGSAWPWGSVPQLAVWVVFVTVAVAYVAQQTFSIGVKPERRIIPVYLLNKRIVLLTFLCTFGAALTYGVALYYMPLFYIFTREIQPLEAGLRLLCFTVLFIVSILLSHGLLRYARFYMPFFLIGGTLLLVGGITHTTITNDTSLPAVMVFTAILGAGVGVLWNLSIPVCSAVLETEQERLDQATLHSIAQLGGAALALSISASIYWNIGLRLVKEAAGFTGFDDHDILALLSGAESTMLDSFSSDVKRLVINAIVTTISRLFFIAIGGAVICFVASVFLKIEPLQFRRWTRAKDPEDDIQGSIKEKTVVYELR